MRSRPTSGQGESRSARQMSAAGGMLVCMRTTLNLNDDLVRQAKQRAAAEDRTLTSVIEDALRRLLAEDARRAEAPYRVPVGDGPRGVLPGIDLSDPRALRDLMDEEDMAKFLEVRAENERRATP